MVPPSSDLGTFFDQMPDFMALAEVPSFEIHDINAQGARQLGYSPAEMIGRKLTEFLDSDVGQRQNPDLIEIASKGRTVRFDRRVQAVDGTWHNYNFAARFIDETNTRFLLTGRQIDDLAHAHSKLADVLKLADLSDDLFVVWDNAGAVSYANAAAQELHNGGSDQYAGLNVIDFVHETDSGLPTLLAQMAERQRGQARVTVSRTDGSPVDLEIKTIYDPDTERWFAVERNITERVAAERELHHLNESLRKQATTDSLTGVANRHALNEALELAVEQGQRFALMLLDMDDFKSVNDALGHGAGDEFLRCVARRIQGVVKLTDVVARLGGDEFVVYLPDADTKEASLVAGRVIDSVSRSYCVAGAEIERSCSIGIAAWEYGDDASAVLRKADRAAYRAKHAGRSRFTVH